MDIAVRVQGIGKRYRIGERNPYQGMRTLLENSVRAPFRRLLGGVAAEPGPAIGSHIWALRDISFDVVRGEMLGIIGRNGAGKSALLKILARITVPTEGQAEVYGQLGSMLEVGTGFHPELTGRENVFLNGAILGMKVNEIRRRFDSIVAFSEIEQFLDTPVKWYSSGMRVRLAFAVAVHAQPEIMVIDEVLSVGDESFRKKSLEKIREISNEGRTVLIVSHSMETLENLVERAIYLERGRLVMDGAIDDVIAQYKRGFGPDV
jgi:lipopolysaccharide transport system ATP-binding protein